MIRLGDETPPVKKKLSRDILSRLPGELRDEARRMWRQSEDPLRLLLEESATAIEELME